MHAPSEYHDVDRSPNPGALARDLDTLRGANAFRAYKLRLLDLLDLRSGDHVLDVGCGTGEDALLLAQVVGPTGRVLGIDTSQTMVTRARERSQDLQRPPEFEVGDAQHLDLPDDVFHACRAERVLMHLDNPLAAVGEMARVARLGAPIAVSEPDWGALMIDAPDRALTRRILDYYCDSFRQGWIGRQLPRLFQEAGLVDISISSSSIVLNDWSLADQLWGVRATVLRARDDAAITPSEATAWLSSLDEYGRTQRFLAAGVGFVVRGFKPGPRRVPHQSPRWRRAARRVLGLVRAPLR